MPDIYEDAEAPDGVKLYDFEDFDTHRNLIFEDAKTSLTSQYPKVHNGIKMELSNVEYADPEHYTIADQKKFLHQDKYLSRRLRGTIKLTDDATGEVLDEKTTTLMRVPYLTERGTFIREGNEWGTIAQERLLPGAYSRIQANGDLETQFNVRPGTGHAFRVNFNPESSQYKFNIAGSNLHMYSLMKELGVSDDDLKDRWGEDVFAANADKYDTRVLDKAYNKIVPEWDRKKNSGRTREEKVELVKQALDKAQVATNVVRNTLPNLFDMSKKAVWSRAGECMSKCASANRELLEEIAMYINHAADKDIDLSLSKDKLIEALRNVIITGEEEANKLDRTDSAAGIIRAAHVKKVHDTIRRKLGL